MKKYLRRGAALLCALVMLLAEVPYARATGTLYFTAVNETVLELSDATMPFQSGGVLYVSSNMFSDKELGISYSNNTVTQIVTLYTAGGALLFDLRRGTATDGQGRAMPHGAIVRSGRVFLPVEMVAEFFGLAFSNSPVALGNVVRLRSEDSVLNDRLFLDAAESLLEYRFEQYEKAKAQGENPGNTQQPGGNTQPGGNDTPDPPTPPTRDEREVYLSFRAAENTGELLDVLAEAEAKGAFYFTAEQLTGNTSLLRRVLIAGHSVGLAVTCGEGETDPLEQLRQANALLWRLTGYKTRLCILENGTAADRDAAAAAGYCCLQADVDRSSAGLTENNAGGLYTAIHNQSGDIVTVWLGGNVTAAGLGKFLAEAEEAGDLMSALTEPVAAG